MKNTYYTIIPQLIIGLICLLIFDSCSFTDDIHTSEEYYFQNELFTRGLSDENKDSCELKDSLQLCIITEEMIHKIANCILRNNGLSGDYVLTTVSEENKTLLYIINYSNGGWAIISGIVHNSNIIMALSTEGSFKIDKIESPEVSYWINSLKQRIKQLYSQYEKTITTRDRFSFDDEPYVWVRLTLDPEYSTQLYSTVGPYLSTKWGQSYPWNYLCPVDDGERCPLGCTTVAFSQMLYYLHHQIGLPDGLYHQIDTNYTWNSGGYYTSSVIRSNYTSPSARWNNMQLILTFSLTPKVIFVGDFMMDIADRLGTMFTKDNSSANFTNSLFYSLGIGCFFSDSFNLNTVKNSLDNSMPVLLRADDHYCSDTAHTWVVDGYKTQEIRTDNPYKWVIMPPDSLAYYNNINYDYVLTESQKQYLYPDIYENQIIHNYSYSYTNQLYMNWGWNGSWNGYYSISPNDWDPDDFLFSDDVQMIYGFFNAT